MSDTAWQPRQLDDGSTIDVLVRDGVELATAHRDAGGVGWAWGCVLSHHHGTASTEDEAKRSAESVAGIVTPPAANTPGTTSPAGPTAP